MPDDEELQSTSVEDNIPSSIEEEERKLFHSCSRPDIVEIGGKEFKMGKEPLPAKKEDSTPWSKVSELLRQAEERFLGFIKKPK